MIIAVTGKIGSGKSTFAKELSMRLSPLGYTLFDVDSLTAACYGNEQFLLALEGLFSTRDRAAISKQCFESPELLAKLEKASLPIWNRLLSEGLQAPKCIIDFPLLFETQLALPFCDLAIAVDASFEVRQKRACARLGWTDQKFALVDAQQAGSRVKTSSCDLAYDNIDAPVHLFQAAELLAESAASLDRLAPRCLPLVGDLAWRQIIRAYCQPHRHYHNGRHLECLFNALPPEVANDPSIALAILYHDFVYSAGADYSSNEALSCQAMVRAARDFFPGVLTMPEPGNANAPVALLAAAMIDSTKGHSIADPWILSDPKRLALTQAFLDADLSILSTTDEGEFWKYDEQIRQEFNGVTDDAYHAARAAAMASFIDQARRPSIYLSPAMKPFESLARARVQALVDKHSKLAARIEEKKRNIP